MNTGMDAELNRINGDAMAAYLKGDIEKALALVQKGYDINPRNSIILYNLACFNALAGNQDLALDWLEKAVEGGFYAPRKIAEDADLKSLEGHSRFVAALARAADLALRNSASDVAINFASEGEVHRLRMQVNQTYETQDYERGLELIKQAYAIEPKDSKIVYTLACLHVLLGHKEEGLGFLEDSVEAGFYCPAHMGKDSDLESVRSHPRFLACVDKAREKASLQAKQTQGSWADLAKRIVDRITAAMGILDYSATVGSTDGYTTTLQSVTEMAPDAKDRPIYALFKNRDPMTDFDKYLPEETVTFALTTGINVDGLYDFILDTIRMAGPAGEEALGRWDAIQAQIGIDLRKDFFDWFNGDSIELTMKDGNSVMMVKVNDAETAREKVTAVIELGTSKISETISQTPELAPVAMMLGMRTSEAKHKGLEGFQNIHFSMAPQPAVWGVADGYLIFGSSADAIALCLATARGEHPSIRENEVAMREAVIPKAPFVNLSLSDRRGLGEEIAEGLGIASMVSGMMGSFIPEPEVRPIIAKISVMLGKLGPVVRKIDFYKSEASYVTCDGQTWHSRTVTHYFSPEERKSKGL